MMQWAQLLIFQKDYNSRLEKEPQATQFKKMRLIECAGKCGNNVEKTFEKKKNQNNWK